MAFTYGRVVPQPCPLQRAYVCGLGRANRGGKWEKAKGEIRERRRCVGLFVVLLLMQSFFEFEVLLLLYLFPSFEHLAKGGSEGP